MPSEYVYYYFVTYNYPVEGGKYEGTSEVGVPFKIDRLYNINELYKVLIQNYKFPKETLITNFIFLRKEKTISRAAGSTR